MRVEFGIVFGIVVDAGAMVWTVAVAGACEKNF
jgi:hypothetical protein